jgi:hypothetical protein
MHIVHADAERIATFVGEVEVSGVRTGDGPSATRKAIWTLPGFSGKTRIRTAFGDLPIEALRVNDPIPTTQGRTLHVRRIDLMGLDRAFLLCHAEAQPIQILAHALGRGLPQRDMLVSPGQELMATIGNSPARQMRAGEITGIHSVAPVLHGVLAYYTFELSAPAFVYAEGIPVLIPLRPPVPDDDEED